MHEETNRLLNPHEAATILGRSKSFLAKLRLRGGGPVYVKIGRSVAYSRSDLDAYVLRNRRRSTSDSPHR